MGRNRKHDREKLPRHGDRFGCPLMDCAGGSSGMQSALTEGQIAKLSEHARAIVTAAGGAQRCSYCGTVYLSSERRRLGKLDNAINGHGWYGI